MIRLTTNYGVIDIDLDFKNAPVTASNFEQYVRDGFYNGTIFHRVIPGFMIQGGGFKPGLERKPTRAPIVNEGKNGLKNKKYSIAMARTSQPDTATSQFFINVKDNNFLDFGDPHADPWGYAVFGKVVAGQDVVDKIEQVGTETRYPHGNFRDGYENVPVKDVIIEKAEVI